MCSVTLEINMTKYQQKMRQIHIYKIEQTNFYWMHMAAVGS